MAYDWGFGKPENELIDAAVEYPPDFEKMRLLLAAGANINAVPKNSYAEDDNILSVILYGYPHGVSTQEICRNCVKEEADPCENCPANFWKDHDGRYLPALCEFFIQNGFDVHAGQDTFGVACIASLFESTKDAYILDAARVLLRAGVDPEVPYDGEPLWTYAEGEEVYCRLFENNEKQADLYSALCELLEKKKETP